MKRILMTVFIAAALTAIGVSAGADEQKERYEDAKKEAKERAEQADVKERAESAEAGDVKEAAKDSQEQRQDRRKEVMD